MNILNKSIAYQDSPSTSKKWISKSNEDRKALIENFIHQTSKKFIDFKVTEAKDNGHITVITEKNFTTAERGIMLIDLENKIKTIDPGLTLWLEPVGDKSKLRNLRGITFKK
jgi:hypothetical protein